MIDSIELTADERDFVQQYIETALWCDPAEPEFFVDPDKAVPCPYWEREAVIDCLAFYSKFGIYLNGERLDQAAHDLYLTRNGAGTGFWDNYKECKYPEWLAQSMDAYAKAMGEHMAMYEEDE